VSALWRRSRAGVGLRLHRRRRQARSNDRFLQPKFRLDAQERRELLADHLPYAEAVRIPLPPPTAPVCRDPFDMPFLRLAAAGLADALVTTDAALLTQARVGCCPIMTPEAFLSGLPSAVPPHP
jgi:predicted nucleic acid-binding protein